MSKGTEETINTLASPKNDNAPPTPKAGAEVDWYTFENRMRELIHRQIEPITNKAAESMNSNREIRKEYEAMKRRVDEFEFILHKTQKGSQGIEEFNKRIYDLVSSRVFLTIVWANPRPLPCRTMNARWWRCACNRMLTAYAI